MLFDFILVFSSALRLLMSTFLFFNFLQKIDNKSHSLTKYKLVIDNKDKITNYENSLFWGEYGEGEGEGEGQRWKKGK